MYEKISNFISFFIWNRTQPKPSKRRFTVLKIECFVLGNVRKTSFVAEVFFPWTVFQFFSPARTLTRTWSRSYRSFIKHAVFQNVWKNVRWAHELHQFVFRCSERNSLNCRYFGMTWFNGVANNFVTEIFYSGKHKKRLLSS